jgi:acyl-CoA thioester hydrolase
VYFEVARTRYMRELGLPYADVMRGGTFLAVIEVGLRYLRPARYDEEIVVRTRCTESSGARVQLEYEVVRGNDLLATGFTRLGAIDAAGRAKRMPEEMRRVFEAAAAGNAGVRRPTQEEER